jgi:GT2 family glycosyltransferase
MRNPTNLGLAGAWNRCVERAYGEWIHILHQDDLVFPGFYPELRKVIGDFPAAGAAFCRHAYLDEHSAWTELSSIESHQRTLLPDWQFRQTVSQRMQCPAVVVRRAVYDQVGGFRTDLPYCLDWEMWARIAASFPVAYCPAILAGYRRHNESETSRLLLNGMGVSDPLRALAISLERLPPDRRSAAKQDFSQMFASRLMQFTVEAYLNGRYEIAIEMVRQVSVLPLSRRDRRELYRISRNSRLKRLLCAIGLPRSSSGPVALPMPSVRMARSAARPEIRRA